MDSVPCRLHHYRLRSCCGHRPFKKSLSEKEVTISTNSVAIDFRQVIQENEDPVLTSTYDDGSDNRCYRYVSFPKVYIAS